MGMNKRTVSLALMVLVTAACSTSGAERTSTTAVATSQPPTTTEAPTTTRPDPADEHVVAGTYFATYRVAEQTANADFLYDADVGDILTARMWTIEASCDVGPCDLVSSSINPDLSDVPPIESTWSYADGAYMVEESSESVGSCVIEDGTMLDGAYDQLTTLTITPTDLIFFDDRWIASALEGSRIIEGTPSSEAAAAGCTVDYSETYDIAATLLESDEVPSLLPSGSQPVGNVIAVSGSDSRIVSINPDGTDQTAIANGASPTWSPGRAVIAFERDGSIFLANADGTDERPITNGRHPRWSPDASSVLFARDIGNDADIMTISVTTGAVQRITYGGWAHSAEWIDDSTIAVQEFRAEIGGDDAWLYWLWPPDGDLPEDNLMTQGAGWLSAAPDGQSIAYTELGTNDLYIAGADGSDATLLVSGDSTSPPIAAAVVWSPDGRRVAWYRAGQLWSADVATGEAAPLGYETVGEPGLAWAR